MADQDSAATDIPDEDLPEIVPDWLSILLKKFGEEPGPLVGLERQTQVEPPSEPDEDSIQLADLLDQMADSVEEQPSDRLATSVEWGPPADTPLPGTQDPTMEDWLQSLQQGEPPPAGAPPAPPDTETDISGWLASIQETPLVPGEPRPGAEAPEWLSELEDRTGAPADEDVAPGPELPAGDEAQEVPDWLQAAEDFATDLTTTGAPAAEPSEQGLAPDWLQAADEFGGALSQPVEPEQEADEEDWLAALAPPAQQPAAPVEADLDWLAEIIPPVGEEPPPQVSSEEPPSPDDVPDWLADLEAIPSSSPAQPAVDAGEPDRLAEDPPGGLELGAQPDAAAGYEAERPAETVPDLEASPREPADEFLAPLTPEEPVAPVGPPAVAVDAPDWLHNLRPVETDDTAETPGQRPPERLDQDDLDTSLPDWLAEFEPAGEDIASPAEAEIETFEEDVPRDLVEGSFQPTLEDTGIDEDQPPPELAQPGAPETAERPMWLRPKPAVEPPETSQAARDIPGWLAQYEFFEPEAAAREQAEELTKEEPDAVIPLTDSGLPPWLEKYATIDPDEQAPVQTQTAGRAIDVQPAADATLGPALEAEAGADAAPPPEEMPVEFETRSAEAQPPEATLPPPESPALPKEDTTAGPEASAEPGPPAEVLPDWLAELEAEQSAVPAEVEPRDFEPEPYEVEAGPLDEPDVPDWLAELRDDSAAPPEAPSADVALAPDEEAVPFSVETGVETDEVPDWLAELEEEQTEATPLTQAPPVEEEQDLPDWLASLRASEPDEPALVKPRPPEIEVETAPEALVDDEEDLPDWLASLRPPESGKPISPGAEAATETEAQEAPGQALDLSPAPHVDHVPIEPPSEEPAEDTDAPDWLASLRTVEPAEPRVGDVEAEAVVPEELEQQPPEPEPPQEGELGLPPDPESDSYTSGRAEIETPSPGEAMATAGEDIPDWLAALRPDEALELSGSAEPAESPAIPEEAAVAGEPETPPWLSQLEAEPFAQAAESRPDLPAQEPGVDEVLAETTPALQDEALAAETEVPDWLKDLDEPTIAQAATEDTATAELGLPEWMADLSVTETVEDRPLEDVALDTAPEVEAKVAVEAVDMVAPAIVEPVAREPVSAEAAQVFYEIATMAPRATPLPDVSAQARHLAPKIARAVLHLIFLLAVAAPLYLGGGRPWLPLPAEAVRPVETELNGIVALQPSDSVALVAFNYTPATAGEMMPLARTVLRKLQGQGMRIIAISLEPEGPAIAQALLDDIAADVYGTRVVNLGYLPGGAAAVRSLSFEGSLAGARNFVGQHETFSELQTQQDWPDITSLTDLNLIVEVGASPGTTRWWVEQLEPASRPPIIVAASKAAEPLLRPYRDTGQLAALVAGISDAAALESGRRETQAAGLATRMLDSQSVATLFLVVLMMGGTVAALMSDFNESVA